MQESTNKIRKIGLPPESFIYTGEHKTEPLHLNLNIYNASHYQTIANATIEQALLQPKDDQVIWLQVSGLHQVDLIGKITQHYKIHPLVTEDILHTEQRAKVEEFTDYFFLTLKALHWQEKSQKFSTEQISIVFGKGFLLTFQEQASPLFAKVQERLQYTQSRLREGQSDYLAYTLIDLIVDQYFLILENLGGLVEKLETEVISKPAYNSPQMLYRLKQQMFKLRKAAWPLREVINHLLRSDGKLISQNSLIYLRDVYDHTIQIIETTEVFHDRLDSLLDVHLSTMTNRMNEIMKVLTIIATIFIPMTFIASIYGMNFQDMPELHWRYGYPVVLAVMLFIAIAMLIYFKRKKWW